MTEPALPTETTVRWFGPSWGAPVCHPDAEMEVPAGTACRGGCSKPIQPGEQGVAIPLIGAADAPVERVPYHLRCFLANILGDVEILG